MFYASFFGFFLMEAVKLVKLVKSGGGLSCIVYVG